MTSENGRLEVSQETPTDDTHDHKTIDDTSRLGPQADTLLALGSLRESGWGPVGVLASKGMAPPTLRGRLVELGAESLYFSRKSPSEGSGRVWGVEVLGY